MNRPRTLALTYGSYNAVRMLIGVYHTIFFNVDGGESRTISTTSSCLFHNYSPA